MPCHGQILQLEQGKVTRTNDKYPYNDLWACCCGHSLVADIHDNLVTLLNYTSGVKADKTKSRHGETRSSYG